MEQKRIKIMDLIQNKVSPLAGKISSQRHFAAIRDGMTAIIPLTIIGGFAILLASPPVPENMKPTNMFFRFMLIWQSWAQKNSDILMTPYNLTIGLLAIYVLVAITYYLAKHYKMDIVTNLVSSVLIFLIVAAPTVSIKDQSYLPQSQLGATGMFAAILISIVSVEINRYFIKHKFTIKLPESVPSGVAAPFEVLTPLVFSTILFSILNKISLIWFKSNLAGVVYLIMKPFANVSGTLPAILLLATIAQLLWFFGIHGDNVVGVVVTPITTLNIALNLQQYQAGKEMTHIFAGAFYQVWGGWIVYPAFLTAMIFLTHSERLKALSKLAPVGTMFNINEPLIFGIPTVLNPLFFIPKFVCVFVNIIIAYTLTSLHIVGNFYIYTPWTTPGILQVFLASMDWKNVVLWIAVFALDVLICAPFVRVYDHQLIAEENGTAEKKA